MKLKTNVVATYIILRPGDTWAYNVVAHSLNRNFVFGCATRAEPARLTVALTCSSVQYCAMKSRVWNYCNNHSFKAAF